MATMGTLGLVIDARIVGEQSDLERPRTTKFRKYADNSDVIYRSSSPGGVSGAKQSASDFLTLGTITRRDLAVIATRVLIRGIIAHRDFNRSTAVTFGR